MDFLFAVFSLKRGFPVSMINLLLKWKFGGDIRREQLFDVWFQFAYFGSYGKSMTKGFPMKKSSHIKDLKSSSLNHY